jgi:hypothetical protein
VTPQQDRLFADPVLTANIYCTGRLDAVLFRAVAPFWRELRSRDPERLCFLWVMRYGKGGEHLKVRIHGPDSWRPVLRDLLAEKVLTFLASLPPPQETPREPPGEWAPVIDAEDETDGGDHPDRSLLWTTYGRSAVSLGGKPFLTDDRYAALFTRCLAAGCERVLALEPGAEGALAHSVRQRALLTALIRGLAALRFPPGERASYLAYHRDWLLRFSLPPEERAESEPVERLCRRLDGQIARMGEALLPLRRAVDSAWSGNGQSGDAEDAEEEPDAGWRRSLAGLLGYIAPLCRDPHYRLDPFASDPVFAPVFKVFHGLANQLGLKRMDEAFAHQVLLRIAEASGNSQARVA